jgi:hypothetical protein
MPASINSTSSSPGGLVTTGDVDNELVIQTGDVTAISIDASQNVAFTGAVSTSGAVSATTLTVNSNNISADNSLGFRNRIINGDMRIDQRNAGASVTPDNVYTLDRWAIENSQTSKLTVQQNAGSVTPPAGFTNYLGVTSSSAYSVLSSDYFLLTQSIEGFNTADLGFGTANAKTITISFWVRSSLTGTFGAVINNSGQNRSYPFTYTISSADTWEQKSVTITGDTSGTWLTNNGIGIRIRFGLGVGSNWNGTAGAWTGTSNIFGVTGATSVVGTNGATWYVTGVQLEVGSVATPFERRPFGTELVLCKRYYDKTFAINTAPAQNAGRSGALETVATRAAGASGISSYFRFSVPMRATPSTVTFYNPSAANGQARNLDLSSDCTSTSADNINEIGGKVVYTLPASTVATNLISVHWSADAEL